MINKIEFFGIALSILAMAGALWLLNLNGTAALVANTEPAATQPDIIVIGDGEDQIASIASAVMSASDARGRVERLIIDDVVAGTGPEATEGNTVTVDYVGTLQTGQEFDSSYKRGEPFTFTLGEGRVIEGWERGVTGMQVGGKRIVVVPPELGYGTSGFGPIPGNATLVFTIELLEIK